MVHFRRRGHTASAETAVRSTSIGGRPRQIPHQVEDVRISLRSAAAFEKSASSFAVWQLAKPQQVADFLKGGVLRQLVNINAAIGEYAASPSMKQMLEVAATTPSSPLVGVTVLVDIVFFYRFLPSLVRGVSQCATFLYTPNSIDFPITSGSPKPLVPLRPANKISRKTPLSLFSRGGRVCALHHSYCPTITNVTSLRFAPARQRYLLFISISPACGHMRPRLNAASISQLPLQKTEATRPTHNFAVSSNFFFLLPAKKIRPHYESDDQRNDQRSGRLPHIIQ